MSYFTKLRKLVKENLKNDKTGHAPQHIFRVYRTALYIARFEKNVDLEILKAAAFLHDIVYTKGFFKGEHGDVSAKLAKGILRDIGFPPAKRAKVLRAIELHNWFFHSERDVPIEIKILRDADRIDAIGSHAIERAKLFYGKDKLIEGLERNISAVENNLETSKGKELALKKIRLLRRHLEKISSSGT